MDRYVTLRPGTEATGEFEDRKSRFIAQLIHVESAEEAAAHQAAARAQHYDARHHVPAWILADGTERASDDGEPQHTSGMPTLEVLRGAGLRDVSCVTTRYFGGTLLGPGGLVRAYTAAAQRAVEQAREAGVLVEMTQVVPVDVEVPYALYERVNRLIAQAGGKVSSSDFTTEVCLHAVFHDGDEGAFVTALTELVAGEPSVTVGTSRFAEF